LTPRHGDTVELVAHNGGAGECELVVSDTVYGVIRPTTVKVQAGRTVVRRWRVSKSLNWRDVTVTMAGDDTFLRRFAGRVESGRRATSDPALGQA
jgi:phospholipase C